MFVLDASILVKLFRPEDDSAKARDGVRASMRRQVPLLAPSLVLYEALAVALHYEMPFEIPLMLISDLRDAGFAIVEPTTAELLLARRIASSRYEGRRHPELEDSIYHAMAIERGGIFVTADRKHVERAGHFGDIQLLADWSPPDPTPPRP
jgi:predicted nucleic acid-binding protein